MLDEQDFEVENLNQFSDAFWTGFKKGYGGLILDEQDTELQQLMTP